MPLWIISHPEGTFTDNDSKSAFSKDITKIYTDKISLPAFYVVVQFIKMAEGDVWVGGAINEGDKPFIRVVIEHTAVNVPAEAEDAVYRTTCQWVDNAMKPHIADKGYDSEYHISENDRRLWKINGLIPPPWKSEEEKLWIKANKALPWSGDH
jgi:hypothetical protein